MSRIKHVLVGLAVAAALVAVPAGARAGTESHAQPVAAGAAVVTPANNPSCALCW